MDEGQLAREVEGRIQGMQGAKKEKSIKSVPNRSDDQQQEGGPDGDTTQPFSPYRVEDNCIVMDKETGQGLVTKRICNFAATVSEEIILDDGVETNRTFLIDGQLQGGGVLPTARVPSNQFGNMAWVTREWGLRAIVHAGQVNKDYLREAIQTLSTNARRRRVFQHTGWREISGQWVYLTTNGAVGQDGFEVDLGSELSRYRLPSKAEDPVGAMRISLKLLEIAPLHITVPLWAGVFRAPLANAFPVDLSLWLEGMTGTLKSTLAALFLCHYGEFDRVHLPGAWVSTANQLERRAFLLKDALLVIDEYVPGLMDRRELETKASRLLRAQGNLAGRGRLRADLSEHPAFPPRGLILSTGEQHPPGQSLLARTLVIRIERGHVNMESLSEAQKLAGRLPHAMAGYITWLGPQMAQLPALLRDAFERVRARVNVDGNHLRIPEVLAHLWLGFDCVLTYAEEINACSNAEAEDLRTKGLGALLQLGTVQGQLVEEERPSLRFLRVLAALITQGRATLLFKNEPAQEPPAQEPPKGSDLLGWYDDDNLYLIPEASFKAVSRFCQDAGEPLSIRLERLRRDLAEERILDGDRGRLTATVSICGKTKRVLKLRIKAINVLLGEDFPL